MKVLFLVTAILLGLVHLFAGKLRFLDVIPRSRWLSFAGGVAVAYVCIHLLPELSRGQLKMRSELAVVRDIENHVYLCLLFGLAVFYGMERAAKRSRHVNKESNGRDVTSAAVFRLHLVSYGAYNLLIGYLLVRGDQQRDLQSHLIFASAMALHFVGNDYGLRQDHKQAYHRVGRWILSAAIIGGCLIGLFVKVEEAAVAVMFAFLSGGVMLNVLKEELPEERESSFTSFALGAVVYATLLQLVS